MSENKVSRREALKTAGWAVPAVMAISIPASAAVLRSPDGSTGPKGSKPKGSKPKGSKPKGSKKKGSKKKGSK